MDSFIFEASRYVWPILIIFQVVVTIIAVLKVKGTGPILMLAGTIITAMRSIGNFLPLDMSFSDGESMGFWALMAFSFVGRVLFLIGLLLMVQKVYKPEVSSMGRTEF